MKTSRSIFIFTIINLIATIIFTKYLPEQVIFGMTGNLYATEFIPKWYNLMIPIAQVIACGVIFAIDIFERGSKQHKYRYLTAYVAVSATTFLLWVLMFLQKDNFKIGTELNWPWTIIILFPIALFMLAEGFDEYFYKPMTEKSIFGFSWVRANPIVWASTHKFSGTTCIISALLTFVISVLNELIWHTCWIYLVVVLIWLFVYYIATIIYSRSVAEKYRTV